MMRVNRVDLAEVRSLLPTIGRIKVACLLLMVLCLSLPALAQEPLEFETQQMQDRFDALTFELRCAVCQNQSLADSDAPLAHDLRREIHGMMVAGQSDEQIKQFMVDRYGDFVLYRPPVQANTWFLWLGPLLMLVIGGWVLRANIKKRSALLAETADHNADERRAEITQGNQLDAEQPHSSEHPADESQDTRPSK